jgi:hypothetical protein
MHGQDLDAVAFSETVSLGESLAAFRRTFADISETAALGESVDAAKRGGIDVSETITWLESIGVRLIARNALAEVAALSEALTALPGPGVSIETFTAAVLDLAETLEALDLAETLAVLDLAETTGLDGAPVITTPYVIGDEQLYTSLLKRTDSVGKKAQDLSGATSITLRIYPQFLTWQQGITRAGVAVGNPALGQAGYTLVPGDITVAGVYNAEWFVVFADGTQRTFPAKTPDQISARV